MNNETRMPISAKYNFSTLNHKDKCGDFLRRFQAALDICNNSPQLMSWGFIGMRIISDGV
jgi:hypothetical protein